MLVCRLRGHGPVVVFPGASQRVEERVVVGDIERVCRRCGAVLEGGVPQEGDWISRECMEQPVEPYFDADLN